MSATPESTTTPATAPPPPRRGLLTTIGIAEAAYSAAAALPLLVGLGLKVQQLAPDNRAATLGLLTALSGAAIVVANPICGHLSDRTSGRFGMRRPWILGGAFVAATGLLLTALAGSVGLLAVAVVLSAIGTQAMVAGLTATIVDQFAPADRIRAAGIFSTWNLGGVVPAMIIAQVFPASVTTQFAIVAVLVVGSGVLISVVLPDRVLSTADRQPVSLGSLARALLVLPSGARDFRILWVQRLIVSFGISLMSAYALYYVQSRLGLPSAAAVSLVGITFMITTALSAVSAYFGGRRAARQGRAVPLLFWATIVIGAALLLKAVTAGVVYVVIAAVASGVALGLYYAVDLGLVTRVLPDEIDTGRYLGTFAMAKQLPAAIAPAMAPLLIGLGTDPLGGLENYFLLYLVCGVGTIAAAFLVLRLRIAV